MCMLNNAVCTVGKWKPRERHLGESKGKCVIVLCSKYLLPPVLCSMCGSCLFGFYSFEQDFLGLSIVPYWVRDCLLTALCSCSVEILAILSLKTSLAFYQPVCHESVENRVCSYSPLQQLLTLALLLICTRHHSLNLNIPSLVLTACLQFCTHHDCLWWLVLKLHQCYLIICLIDPMLWMPTAITGTEMYKKLIQFWRMRM